MAEKTRNLDVWILQLNVVYPKVPYAVVTDWIQQGRLLPEDNVRVPGADKWHVLGKVPALAAFLPRPEPLKVEDTAEALEPIEGELSWGRGRGTDEDDDVDMIPLIDISLVLLIFFMMTAATSAGLFSPINTPSAQHQLEVPAEDMLWVGVDTKDSNGTVENDANGQPIIWYSVGQGKEKPVLDLKKLPAVADALAAKLNGANGEVAVRLRADRDLRIQVVNAVSAQLHELEGRLNTGRSADERIKIRIFGEVSEPQRASP
jgi:biopolymer transport protein ExbD